MNDFLAKSDIETENGRMVLDIIERISETWGEEIPKEYKRFIANVCKQSSVAGLLQVTSNPLFTWNPFVKKLLTLGLWRKMVNLGSYRRKCLLSGQC
jgi:hypothetical protein